MIFIRIKFIDFVDEDYQKVQIELFEVNLLHASL